MPMSMGKVLGGGSSINVMVWARGHRSDWDYFAQEAGDDSWNYEHVLGIYREIEDWQGRPIRCVAASAGRFMCSPLPIPARRLWPC